jgi:lipopolysaccharide transport protein LptA
MPKPHHSADGTGLSWALFGLLCFFPPVLAEGLEFSADDIITVTALRAWEGDAAEVVHFSGDFKLQAPDWTLAGDTAVVYGKLDDPDRVVVEGAPARISFLRQAEANDGGLEEDERVDGSATTVEYFRATDKLKMQGGASLTRKDSTLVSETIEYDVDADRYSASGEGGINIQYNPEDD